ncbi:hypothetical protein PLICRDRAFT_39743 [Plicaturopsis crispa FD-325 SS-3]|nr:hypothetical protein PLICRDRAFT_39743 [Plicaturopsis crispa FD-325 SS-3]
MPLLDRITDGLKRVLPAGNDSRPVSTSMSGGIGGGHGMVPFEDDMIVSKPTIIFHSSQIFFNFLAMACFASVASFQAHWGVGPSGLSGFAIFITVAGIFLSLFMLLIPVAYEKYDRFARLARALKEDRVAFILTGAGTTASLIIAFVVTISAWTEPGCKNPDNDPNQDKGSDFKDGLSGWCNTKKAGAVFLWLCFGFWLASLGVLIWDWRQNKSSRPRDPPFEHPMSINEEFEDDENADEESAYHSSSLPPRIPPIDNSNSSHSPFSDVNRYSGAPSSGTGYSAPAAGRPSMDMYGAFSDPAPSGFGGVSPAAGPGPVPASPAAAEAARISRTMQYADPYAAVRASIAGSAPVPPAAVPPSYESYQGYR